MLRIWLNHLHWNDTALNNWPTLSMFVCLVPPAKDYSNKYAEKQQCPTKWQKMNFVFKATDNTKTNFDLFERKTLHIARFLYREWYTWIFFYNVEIGRCSLK